MLGQRYHSLRWSSAWFTAILEAQAFWTTQQNRLNEPLATLLEVSRLNLEERTGRTKIPIHGALNWIGNKLPTYDSRHINAQAWDAFAELYLFWFRSDPQAPRFKYVFLQFVHPVNRCADPLLTWLRRSESDESAMQLLVRMPKGLFSLKMLMLTQYCYNNGRMADVKWIIDLFHRIGLEREKLDAGDVLELNRWAPIRKRRTATRAEIAAGLPVDAQDGLIVMPFRGTAEDVRKQFEFASKVCCLSA